MPSPFPGMNPYFEQAAYWQDFHMSERLPEIPIPLRHPDGDARINLQEILDRVYDAYGYEDFIYDTPAEPPLSPDDADWARQFLPAP